MFEVPIPATLLVSSDGKVLRSYAQAVDMHRIALSRRNPKMHTFFDRRGVRLSTDDMVPFLSARRYLLR